MTYQPPRFRPCGVPGCAICRYNLEGAPPDSGHGEEHVARDLIAGAFAIVLLFVFLFVLLPVIQS